MRSLKTFFAEDTRAVAPVIGFILLFGIGVLAFSGYQAVQVPQQNAETEFQHQENVRNDLTVVRNAISRAGQQNQSQFESVRLGTMYRERIFALNPPDPAGTLRTSQSHTITLDNGTESVEVETRFLEYRDGYNELTIGRIYYENSVLYLDAENGQRVILEDQNLVQENGNTTVITALQRDFSRSATGRVTVELYPTDGSEPIPTGNVNVTLPTNLTEGYWRAQLEDEDPISNFSYNNTGAGDVNQVLFNVSFNDLKFNTVGINDEPAGNVSNVGGDRERDNTGSNPLPLDYRELEAGTEGEVAFRAINVAGESIAVTGFSVDATSFNKNAILDNGNSNEVDVVPDSGVSGSANRMDDGKGSRYDADGTAYSLDDIALIDKQSSVEISTRFIKKGNNIEFDLEKRETRGDADVTVTVEYDKVYNGVTEQEFYFEDVS